MPEISRFFGIIIYMYADDHNPPHLHANYSGETAWFEINTGEMIRGSIARRAERLVQDWIELYRQDLLFNFEQLQNGGSGWKKIQPLK